MLLEIPASAAVVAHPAIWSLKYPLHLCFVWILLFILALGGGGQRCLSWDVRGGVGGSFFIWFYNETRIFDSIYYQEGVGWGGASLSGLMLRREVLQSWCILRFFSEMSTAVMLYVEFMSSLVHESTSSRITSSLVHESINSRFKRL